MRQELYQKSILRLLTSSYSLLPQAPIKSPPQTLLSLCRQRRHLIQQRLTLARRIFRNLIPQMIHLLSRRTGRIPLRRLNPRDLHLKKELGHFDRQTASHTANPRLSRKIHIQTILKLLQVGAREWICGRELGERELERRLRRLAEVDGREGYVAGGHVGDFVDGGGGRGARDAVFDGCDGGGDFSGERSFANYEASGGGGLAGREGVGECGAEREGAEEGERGEGLGVHLERLAGFFFVEKLQLLRSKIERS